MEQNNISNFTPETVLYEVKFVALQPTENSGHFRWRADASQEEAYAAFCNYLNGTVGPERYKIQTFEVCKEKDTQQELPFDAPIEPQSQRIH